jgi:spore coat protein CotH
MLKKYSRPVVALISVLSICASLLVAQPAAASSQSLSQFYNSNQIFRVDLTIGQDSIDHLNSPDNNVVKQYTGAQVLFTTQDGQQSPNISIGLRLKGSTSLERLDARPSFKIKFNWSSLKGQRFLGLKRMTLNAMTQDTSMIHEASAYRLYNLMGVVAPRTGYAKLYINGTFKGLYLNVETPDEIMLSTRFSDPTKHLYEGQAFKDFRSGNDDGDANWGAFTVDVGWSSTPNKSDLSEAIRAATMPVVSTKTGVAWFKAVSQRFDVSKLVMQFAVENFTGNWDSYSGSIVNNYFARSNENGKLTLMPWGADQTFGENRKTQKLLDDYFFKVDTASIGFPWMQDFDPTRTSLPRGILFQKCLRYAPCKSLYLNDLKAVTKKAIASKQASYMRDTARLIADYSNSGAVNEQNRSVAWLTKQITRIRAVLTKNKIRY